MLMMSRHYYDAAIGVTPRCFDVDADKMAR